MDDESIHIQEGVAGLNPAANNQILEQTESSSKQSDNESEVAQQSSETDEANEESALSSPPPPAAEESPVEASKGLEKRINKLTREKREAEERAMRAEIYAQQLHAAQRQSQAPMPVQDPYAPKAPDKNDPKYANNPLEYIDACVDYQKKVLVYESQKAQLTRYHQDIDYKYTQKVEEARQKYEDFDEVINRLGTHPTINTHPQLMEVISGIKELDNSADVAYHLAKNPAELVTILNRPSRMAAVELGRLSVRLETPAIVRNPAPPPPTNPRGGGTPKSTKRFDELSIDEMEKMFARIR